MTDRIDIAAVRLRFADLARQAQPHVDADLLIAVADDLRELCAELAERRDTRKASTRDLAARISRLEQQLKASGMATGERIAAICMRLGIGRRKYYRARRTDAASE